MSLISDSASRHHGTVRSKGASKHHYGKRVFDVFFSLASLVFLAPVLTFIAIALLIIDGRPIFYRHKRIGRNGRPFFCLKFRTMRKDADKALAELLQRDPARLEEWTRTRKLMDDPRVHKLGRYLRASSLDELPQFINVLNGTMTIVGPRPITLDELNRYGSHASCYMAMTPGITGPWQISKNKNASYEERVHLDVEYFLGCSLALDFAIIWKTIGVVLFARNEQ
ncbi:MULTISPECIES: sugar transferase [Alphaproteobacteria]|uniref:Bacterial sugar transferase domain-containing protein n=2 Tax=Alphaproteobacteria TaxID=28211 RepID=A0A512HN63_9HYPH|nr:MULTISPECIES: sugar transferase [Alphaproteobacteria]GEO86882.1 hypothetical protein RNA01_38140 [Ciceribacter naphthalenivorans]GLR24026.1 hypothetical protein GCM10007920_38200 [Ciceribacter naphthalenivorans]GLT06882.1 hypothetical protein GCM10007926_38200 [Sphingomonas psychrolutea]